MMYDADVYIEPRGLTLLHDEIYINTRTQYYAIYSHLYDILLSTLKVIITVG